MGPQQHPHPSRSRAGGEAVHSITSRLSSAANNILLFDQLIGAQAHDIGHVEVERLDGFEVADKL